MPLVTDPTSPSGYRYVDDSMSDYPALDRTPAGNPLKPTDDAVLKARTASQSTYDPDHIEVTQHGNMTIARDVSPPLPLRGPTLAFPTTSSVAEQTKRRLDADLILREAIYEDGQTPQSFDLTRGAHSGSRDHDGRTAQQMREDLHRADGASDFDIAMRRVMGR